MPYITKEQVAEIRNNLKKAFPAFKFSVVRENYSSVNVYILEAPVDLTWKERTNYQVNANEECIKETWPKEIADVLVAVRDIIRENRRVITVDADYGGIPNFYSHLQVGKYDKPFVFKSKAA